MSATLLAELRDLQECVDLLQTLERKIGEMELRDAAGDRTVRYLASRFRDLLDVMEGRV